MADQIYNVTSGFYDAINRDRVYTAAQMNMPYKRLVSNGVFATPAGTPSTDLQVIAGTGRAVRVSPGNALVGDRWLENTSIIPISVPVNTALVPRLDSVIVQVNVNSNSRAGGIIYRTGTPASLPEPPALDTSAGISEYRLANVAVAPGAASITTADITDCRGSADCPWVTSLVYQVDTSVLWAQYQAAYRQYFNTATADFDAYVAQQQQAWEDFLAHAAAELDVTPSVMTLTSTYVMPQAGTEVPIGIPSFSPDTDILLVYVNGLQAQEGERYELSADGTAISLYSTLDAGQTISFVAFKSLVTAELDSVVSLIQRLDSKVSGAIADSGWMQIQLEAPYAAASGAECSARKIGLAVYLRGAVTGYDSGSLTVGAVPMSMAPVQDVLIPTAGVSAGASAAAVLRVEANTGTITIDAAADDLSGTDEIALDAAFVAGSGYGAEMIFALKGNVSTYAELPDSAAIGDVYRVLTANTAHGVKAGDCVLWDGSAWEVVATTVTDAQIDDVLNDYF